MLCVSTIQLSTYADKPIAAAISMTISKRITEQRWFRVSIQPPHCIIVSSPSCHKTEMQQIAADFQGHLQRCRIHGKVSTMTRTQLLGSNHRMVRRKSFRKMNINWSGNHGGVCFVDRIFRSRSDHNGITKMPILQLRSETERAPRRGSSSCFAKPQNSCKAKTARRTTLTQNFFTFWAYKARDWSTKLCECSCCNQNQAGCNQAGSRMQQVCHRRYDHRRYER